MADICRRLDRKGFGASHDGNVSVKYGGRIFATPTSMSKADITPDHIITLDLSGKKLEGHGGPFSEIELHLAAYNARPDIFAVCHAHPPYATARGLVGQPLSRPAIPESVVSIGACIPVADFAMPGSKGNQDIVADALKISNVFMLAGNGVLSVGTDVLQAYLRLELVEHLAKIDFIASKMGEPMQLDDSDVKTLLDKRAKAGLAPPSEAIPPENKGPSIQNIIEEEIGKAIEELK